MDFLSRFGDLYVSSDSKHEAGPDFCLNNHYYIECVCSTFGNDSSLSEYTIENSVGCLNDYNEREPKIYLRLLASIKEKREKYAKYVENNQIDKDKPYIIFLSPGRLAEMLMMGVFAFDLLSILYAVGKPYITIDLRTGKQIGSGYTRRTLKNYNDADVCCNIFADDYYKTISAILFTEAYINEQYDHTNTYLFINPFANIKVKKKDFKNLIYWSADKNGIYVPRKNGRKLKY